MVAVEVGQLGVRGLFSEQRRGGDAGLVERGGPVLDPYAVTQDGVVVVGDVADGVDVGSLERRDASTSTPLSGSSPADSARAKSGLTPMPTTIPSASIVVPSVSWAPVARPLPVAIP